MNLKIYLCYAGKEVLSMENKDFIFMNNPAAETEQVKVIPEEFSFIEKLNALIKYVNSLPIKPESEVIERLENVEKIMAGYDGRLTSVESGLQENETNLTTTNNLLNSNVKEIEALKSYNTENDENIKELKEYNTTNDTIIRQIKDHANQTESTVEDLLTDVNGIEQCDIYTREILKDSIRPMETVTLNEDISAYSKLCILTGAGEVNLYQVSNYLSCSFLYAATNLTDTNQRASIGYFVFKKIASNQIQLINSGFFYTVLSADAGSNKASQGDTSVTFGDSEYPNSTNYYYGRDAHQLIGYKKFKKVV